MPIESSMLALGTVAPDFGLPEPSGRVITLDDALRGERGLVVAFVSNHCPYVLHIAEVFGRMARIWAELGVRTVGINPNDPGIYPDDAPELMAAQAARWGWDFPYLVDEGSAARAFAAQCTPDFFLVAADRTLVYRGQFDDSRPRNDVPVTGSHLDAAVRAVSAGKPPDPDQIPSIGCSIRLRASDTLGEA